ncbi:MAG: serpin family protein [Cyanobacteria bacterium P01_G01_bin.19]
MNRNTVLGTLGVVVLLILMAIVSQQEAISNDSIKPNKKSPQLPAEQIVAETAKKASTQMSQLANVSNHFGFDLFDRLQQQQPAENIVISPNSIAIALAMAKNGTGGETETEMTRVLKLEQLEPTTVNTSYQKLIETLENADPNVELAIANSLWVNQNISLKNKFVNDAREFYEAKVTNLDFASFIARSKINNWVAKSTAEKIPTIVDSTSVEDALYLINAVYFQGMWTNKFDAKETREQPFYNPPNSPQTLAMMNQTGEYRYHENDLFQAVRLPYGKKEELGMYIFLPKGTASLADLNQQLNFNTWQEWLSQMRSQQGNITIPRFKLEYEADLVKSLSQLGMKQIFNPSQANFSAMTDASVAVDTVKHKTFIEVNEEGTEAAAVTSIGIRITSATPQTTPFNINVNRPFFFAIRDDITETILFMGNIIEP